MTNKLRWCSPVKHFALSRRRSRVRIPAGALFKIGRPPMAAMRSQIIAKPCGVKKGCSAVTYQLVSPAGGFYQL